MAATKDAARVGERMPAAPGRSFWTGIVASGAVKGVSTDPVRGPFEGFVLRPTDTCPEDGVVCSERISWAAARRFKVLVSKTSRGLQKIGYWKYS